MLSNRIAEIESFLTTCGLGEYVLQSLPADASLRQYYKVVRENQAILLLMDCPSEHYSIIPFMSVAKLLIARRVKIPEIYACDELRGFVLLEYFAGPNIHDVLDKDNQSQIYQQILEMLVQVQQHCTDFHGLELYSIEKYLTELEIYLDWYVEVKDSNLKESFLQHWYEILTNLPVITPTFCHLDFHVENMMVTDSKAKIKSSNIGIIDFQDARVASPIYDVVSLLEDARFEVSFEFAQELFKYYLKLSPEIDVESASMHYHILGAQRNMRILGVFARKAQRDKNSNYLQYIPRVRNYLEHDLMLPSLFEVQKLYREFEVSSKFS